MQTRDPETKAEKLKCRWNKIIRKSPINVKKKTKNFKEIIKNFEKENGTEVFRSKPHSWDPENKLKLVSTHFPGSLIFSKLLTSLSLGVTSKFMMTPKDKDLRAWLESQNVAGVSLEDLFKKSLELQKGDLYKTILSIENILSEYWRDKKREHLGKRHSLQSITNHCPGLHKRGYVGSWYHLFGTMLLGCVEGYLWSDIVGRVEAAGGRILNIKSAKKMKINLGYHLLVGSDPQEEKSMFEAEKLAQDYVKINLKTTEHFRRSSPTMWEV